MGQPFADWIGRSVERSDLIVDSPICRLAATLDHDGAHWPVGHLPPLGHWLFHLPEASRSALGRDGHPSLGAFLPPIAHPRRMWAGGRLTFHGPVAIGDVLVKRTTIAAIEEKNGGAMTLVTLRHELSVDGSLAIEEEQDLVYLPIAPPGGHRPVDLPAPASERRMTTDPALLFRFSALTFNAHRIHYDRAYARDDERYPDLVVHGPLQAMLLLDDAMIEGIEPSRFDFRARAPLFVGQPLALMAAREQRWVRNNKGIVTMTATVA